jgi:hypothetical protein
MWQWFGKLAPSDQGADRTSTTERSTENNTG